VSVRLCGRFDADVLPALTAVSVALPVLDMLVEWRRCGMTADYLADYLAYAFERRDVARTVISTAANELLENAAKFSTDKRSTVRVAVRLRGPALELEVENVTDAGHADRLADLLDALARGDAEALFAERLEARERGGLGLIVLAKDYAAGLGARIVEQDPAGTFSVTVRASIAADEVEQR
jgi:hypothetical protein